MGEIVRVGDIAGILRCQVPRQRADKSEICEYPGEEWPTAGRARFIARDAGYPVAARLGPKSLKFLLRQHDIVIAISGTRNTVGLSALVAEKPEKNLLSTKNFVIVRPDPALADPVWLYYRLAQDDIRARLAGCATGDRSLYLPPGAIGDLEIRLPDGPEMESVRAAHAIFLEGFLASSARLEKERMEWEKLRQVLKIDD